MIELKPRNDTQLAARFGTLTIAIDHLSSAYIDMHHAALDTLQSRLSEIRSESLEASKADWSDIDLCTIVANLIGMIEVAKDSEADEDGVIVPAIEALRSSDAFTSAREKAMPLASVMAQKGTRNLLAKLQRDLKLHHTAKDLWQLACLVELTGDVAQYFDDGTDWPVIAGSLPQRMEVIQRRVEILERLDYNDSAKLIEAFADHLESIRQLNETEAKN